MAVGHGRDRVRRKEPEMRRLRNHPRRVSDAARGGGRVPTIACALVWHVLRNSIRETPPSKERSNGIAVVCALPGRRCESSSTRVAAGPTQKRGYRAGSWVEGVGSDTIARQMAWQARLRESTILAQRKKPADAPRRGAKTGRRVGSRKQVEGRGGKGRPLLHKRAGSGNGVAGRTGREGVSRFPHACVRPEEGCQCVMDGWH